MSPPIPPEPDPRRTRFLELRKAQPNASRESIIAQVEREFAVPTADLPEVAREATATPERFPAMVNAPVLTAQIANAPRIPLPRTPGVIPTALIHAGNTLLPFADEAAAVLSTGKLSGPEYETNRRLSEYLIGSSANEHPVAAGLGTAVGAGTLAGVLPAASPEVLAGKGTGRFLGRAVGEGAGLGALYGAGASDPGLANRIRGGVIGGVEGGALAGGLGGLGALSGATRGTPAGRAALNVAEAGDADIGMAQQRVREAMPESPLVAADVLGPIAPSRVRAASAVPGPGQRIGEAVFPPREAGRISRIGGVIEDATGTTGLNPYTAAEDLRTARSQEADRLFAEAYQVPLPKNEVVRVPQVKTLVQRLRERRRAAGLPVPTGKVTTEELHSVRKILDTQAQALSSPAASSADKEAAFEASGLRDRIDEVLKSIPEFATADEAFTDASRVMEGYEVGRNALQRDPAEVEHLVGKASPNARQAMRLGLPASITRQLESGGGRGALGRIGLGQSARPGRQRILGALVDPKVEQRLSQAVADEELMTAAEQAQRITSPTAPTRESISEAALGGLSFGEPGMIRRLLLRSLHGGPNPEALANDMRMLTTGGQNRPALERLLNEAVEARQGRGENRLGGLLGSRAGGTAVPTIQRTSEVQDRAKNTERLEQAKEYYQALIATGADPDRALGLTKVRFGL